MEVVINYRSISKVLDSDPVQERVRRYADLIAAHADNVGPCRYHRVFTREGKHPARHEGYGAKYCVVRPTKRFAGYERAHAQAVYGKYINS